MKYALKNVMRHINLIILQNNIGVLVKIKLIPNKEWVCIYRILVYSNTCFQHVWNTVYLCVVGLSNESM